MAREEYAVWTGETNHFLRNAGVVVQQKASCMDSLGAAAVRTAVRR